MSEDWVLIADTGDRRIWELDLGDGTCVRKTEYMVEEALFEQNKALYDLSDGKRWGDGQVVASVPLNVYFDQIAPSVKEGDREAVKKWLNDSDNRMYRTFKGSI